MLKTDDDSVVHVGRVWRWAYNSSSRDTLYAGRVVSNSQVVRPDFRRRDLWEPQWYPSNFLAWAVPRAVYEPAAYPEYCSGASASNIGSSVAPNINSSSRVAALRSSCVHFRERGSCGRRSRSVADIAVGATAVLGRFGAHERAPCR